MISWRSVSTGTCLMASTCPVSLCSDLNTLPYDLAATYVYTHQHTAIRPSHNVCVYTSTHCHTIWLQCTCIHINTPPHDLAPMYVHINTLPYDLAPTYTSIHHPMTWSQHTYTSTHCPMTWPQHTHQHTALLPGPNIHINTQPYDLAPKYTSTNRPTTWPQCTYTSTHCHMTWPQYTHQRTAL